MREDDPAIAWYDRNAHDVADRYEALSFSDVHGWLIPHLPVPGEGTVLDVGAGTGRDVAWLAASGYRVVAVEPSRAMRVEAQLRHEGAGIDWVDDRLPELSAVRAAGVNFDLILLSAVWMHICPDERQTAFDVLLNLLHPAGVLAITLRHGPGSTERAIQAVSLNEIERLARDYGAALLEVSRSADHLGRSEVSWTNAVLAREC